MDGEGDSGQRLVEGSNNGDIEQPAKPKSMSNVLASQKAVLEMSTLISQPALKRSESAELLNLTLHQCARDGDVDSIKKLLAQMGPTVKRRIDLHDDEDLSALHYASRYNHYDSVRALVESGANVNDKDEDGATPLHFAARYKRVRIKASQSEDGNVLEELLHQTEVFDNQTNVVTNLDSTEENSVVLFLVSQGADVNVKDNYGCTPLHFACMRGNELVTWELLRCSGIDIEAEDEQLMRPLHQAASHNEAEICRMLLEAGAKLQAVDEDMSTPLHYTAMEGSKEITELLFNTAVERHGWPAVTAMLQDTDKQHYTALHLAVENRGAEVVELCLERGADVNLVTENYSTPLHLAAVTGDVQITKLLVDKGARINALDVTQSTALHKAAQFNHVDVVKYILSSDPRKRILHRHDKDNFTPLLIAACHGHVETIECLLDEGASLLDTDKNDKTAIYWAAEENNLEALKTLVAHAKKNRELIDKEDRYGNTPLHIAAKKGFAACVRCLLAEKADPDAKNEEEQTPLHLAAKAGKAIVVKEIIRVDKSTLNDEDEDSNTPLHLAASAGHNKAVAALLEFGADIEARNCISYTPLDCAANKGHAKTCKILLESDAPVDPLDKSNTTPLHLACMRGHVNVVSVLLEAEADVTLRDKSGRNCLDMAIQGGHKDVCLAIINSEYWEDALRNEMEDPKTHYRDTPMRKLIRKMPDVAEKVFYKCTTANTTNPDDPNYTITFNYEFIEDMFSNWNKDDNSDTLSTSGASIYDDEDHILPMSKPYTNDSTILKKNHPLRIMVDCSQEDLLAHPLITSLLRHKWNSFGRWVYYLNLLLYCIFLTFLTGYVVTTDAPYSYLKDGLDNCTAKSCENIRDFCVTTTVEQKAFTRICKYIVIALCAASLLRELIQLVSSRLNYFGVENLIEWVVYVSSLLVVLDFNNCQEDTGIRERWQWQLASVAILLSWIELVLFIRKFPRFGIFVVMFTDILYTFLQFVPVYALFIIAYSLSFNVLFGNIARFKSVGYSMVSTAIMMIGEIEYEQLFFSSEGQTGQGYLDTNVNYEVITYLVFVSFFILLTILIMNLLVGLAVDDIKGVQEQAVLKRLAMQVELALDVEYVLPQFIRRKFVTRSHSIMPNTSVVNPLKRCLRLESTFISSSAITTALNPELDDMEKLQENQDEMKKQISTLKQRLKGIDAQNQRMENMLMALLKHNDVEFDEDDIVDELKEN